MKRLVLFLFALLLLASCADLRTKSSKKNPETEKARTLMHAMALAHGTENWSKMQAYEVDFEETFFGKLGERSNPFPETKTTLKLRYIPKTFDGQLEFVSGEWSGKTWGIQAWQTYILDETGKVVFNKNKDAHFWLPTYQYFIEFPARIQEATAIAYAGEKMIDSTLCDGILASWNTLKPQRKTDQYLIWIARDTKLIYKLEYTIRDISTLIKGAVYFKDYMSYDGLMLPGRMPVVSNLVKSGLLHEMQIKQFYPNGIGPETLRPQTALDPTGDNKL